MAIRELRDVGLILRKARSHRDVHSSGSCPSLDYKFFRVMKADHELRGLFCRQLHVNSSRCTRIRGYLQDIPLKCFAITGYRLASAARKPNVGYQQRLALSREIANKASSTFVDHINDEVAIVQDRDLNVMRVVAVQRFKPT